MDTVEVIGGLAAVCSVASFSPQAWRIIRTRSTKGLSPAMYVLTVAAFALWLAFGVMKGEWAIMVPNALCLGFGVFILVLILLPQRAVEKVADKLD